MTAGSPSLSSTPYLAAFQYGDSTRMSWRTSDVDDAKQLPPDRSSLLVDAEVVAWKVFREQFWWRVVPQGRVATVLLPPLETLAHSNTSPLA